MSFFCFARFLLLSLIASRIAAMSSAVRFCVSSTADALRFESISAKSDIRPELMLIVCTMYAIAKHKAEQIYGYR
jgi:hypothetical protein